MVLLRDIVVYPCGSRQGTPDRVSYAFPMPTFDFPTWLLSVLLAPFGLILGSFANVLIHRLPQEDAADRDVVTKPSHCPSCKARIRPWHNIPLVSWLWLRGRCASCGWRIPVRYPLVELLGGLLLAGSVWVFPFGTLIWVKGVVCGYALIVLFFTDLTAFILPDAVQFPLMALGVLFTLPQLVWPLHPTSVWAPGHDHPAGGHLHQRPPAGPGLAPHGPAGVLAVQPAGPGGRLRRPAG